IAQADGREGHLARRNGDAADSGLRDRGGIPADSGRDTERASEQRKNGVLHRRRLLHSWQDSRGGDDQLHRELEGGGDSPGGNSEDYDVERVQSLRDRGATGPHEVRTRRGSDRRSWKSLAGHRGVARRAVRDEGRRRFQARRNRRSGEVLPRRAGKRVEEALMPLTAQPEPGFAANGNAPMFIGGKW